MTTLEREAVKRIADLVNSTGMHIINVRLMEKDSPITYSEFERWCKPQLNELSSKLNEISRWANAILKNESV